MNLIEKLDGHVKMDALISKVNELVDAHNAAVTAASEPKKFKEMTDEDARRVIYGDMKDVKTKAAAEALGLSYGQIYSARGKYTFKHIHKEHEGLLAKAKQEEAPQE